VRRGLFALVLSAALVVACTSTHEGQSLPSLTATTPPAPASVETTASISTTSSTSPVPALSAALPDLARLAVDDNPTPGAPYSRDDWPTWLDLDGDGCDPREEVLRDSSLVPVTVVSGCGIAGGQWFSIYDGQTLASASDLDVDHVVALEQAHRSGGWRWAPQQRAAFANDRANLLAVSASSNRSKGSDTPDQWRPPRSEAWCQTATVYVNVKIAYGLTVTTSERDALGQMLDTCP
jgi:hypothetical protein